MQAGFDCTSLDDPDLLLTIAEEVRVERDAWSQTDVLLAEVCDRLELLRITTLASAGVKVPEFKPIRRPWDPPPGARKEGNGMTHGQFARFLMAGF